MRQGGEVEISRAIFFKTTPPGKFVRVQNSRASKMEYDKYPIVKIVRIQIGDIQKNTGQIKGLPKNPRKWTDDEVSRIAKSIQQTPELLDARPLLLIWNEGFLVCLGGNLRLEGCILLGWQEIPGYIFPNDIPVEKQKEIVIKDNGSFGSWDFQMLASDFKDMPLFDWGVPEFAKDEDPIEKNTAVEDDFDENVDVVKTKCQIGDLWGMGDHRLLCGDSTDNESCNLLRGGGVSRLVADGSSVQCSSRKCWRSSNQKRQPCRFSISGPSSQSLFNSGEGIKTGCRMLCLDGINRNRFGHQYVRAGRVPIQTTAYLGKEPVHPREARLSMAPRNLHLWMEAGCIPFFHRFQTREYNNRRPSGYRKNETCRRKEAA